MRTKLVKAVHRAVEIEGAEYIVSLKPEDSHGAGPSVCIRRKGARQDKSVPISSLLQESQSDLGSSNKRKVIRATHTRSMADNVIEIRSEDIYAKEGEQS